MPERPRLDPTPDFPPVVRTVMEPFDDITPARTTYLDGPVGYYHYVLSRTDQQGCAHRGIADRFGSCLCDDCGAECWSPWWVADGLYGLRSATDPDALDETGLWLDKERQTWAHRAMQQVDPGPHWRTAG